MLQILFAILAGVLTIAAPCILPLLPILLGASVGQKSKTRPLFIVLGFVLVFSVAGLTLSFLSQSLGFNSNTLRDIAIVVLAIFGILLLWPQPFEILSGKISSLFPRKKIVNLQEQGNWSGFVLGLTLGLVWTPCAGPVLGSILTLVATQKDFFAAAILLIAYSLGAGVPMLIIAYGGQYITVKVRAIARYSRLLQIIFGLIIILLAIAIFFNYDIKIYSEILNYFPSLNPML